MKVQDIMTREVFSVGSTQTLRDAAQLMWKHDCGILPVVDEDRQIVGMITDRDIAMAAYLDGKSLEAIPVSAAHSKQIVCCKSGDGIDDVQHMMQTYQVHRIPVVDDKGETVGIVSLNDIARAYQAATVGLTAQDISNTLAAICGPIHKFSPPAKVVAS